MKKIRALYLSPVPDFKGGAERSLFDLLANPNVDPILVVPEDGELAERARSLNIKVDVVDFGSVHRVRRPFKLRHGFLVLADAWRASRTLKAVAQRNGVDIIHTNGLKAHSIALLAKRATSAKLVMHFRDIAYTIQERIVWKFQAKLASRAVFVSRACYPGTRLPANGRVIFNGIDPRPQVALHPNTPIRIGFIGRIHPHKGLHTLLNWMAAAKGRGLATTLSVRGKFTQEAPEYESEIRSLVKELGLQDVVSFEGFFVDPNDVYRDIDVVCAPAQAAEPLARTILEPMSMGIPVIATPTGGTTEMVLDKVTGFIAVSAEDFIGALQVIYSDPETIAGIVESGREHVANNFSKQRLHASISKLYVDVLNER